MPKVSVVMPVFNGERYIGASIESVQAQTSVDLELLICNDGSTDKTLEIASAYAAKDARIRVLSRPNSGRPSFAKNDGIGMATGDYLCFLDHDDLYDPERTAQLVEGLESNPDWVAAFHDMRLIQSDGRHLPGTYLQSASFLQRASAHVSLLANDWYVCDRSFFVFQSLVTGAMHTSTTMIAVNRLPRGAVQFDTTFTIGEDIDLWIRLALLGKIGYLDRVLSSYRQHPTSITQNSEKLLADTATLHKHNYERVKKLLTAAQAQQLRTRIGNCMRDLGYHWYCQYDLSKARAAYREALTWSFDPLAAIGYAKSLIPANIMRRLRRLAGD